MGQAISYRKDAGGVLVADAEQPGAGEVEFKKFFSGKRRTVRQKVKLDAVIQGQHETFSVSVVDISRNGVLMRVDDIVDESCQTAPGNRLVAYSTLVLYHFERGLKIAIEGVVSSNADLVRLVCDVDDVIERVYLAVRLHTEITDEQCQMLGLSLGDDDGQDFETDD
ncbi:MAG: PilZ domain-containing protein [Planctomycetota bacterium]